MRRPILCTLAVVLVMTACAKDDAPPSGDATDPPKQGAAAQKVFGFTSEKVEGGQFNSSELEGKDIALWFYAPW